MPGQHTTGRFYIIDVANLITRCAIVAFTDNSNIAIVTAVWGRNPRPPNNMQLPFMLCDTSTVVLSLNY